METSPPLRRRVVLKNVQEIHGCVETRNCGTHGIELYRVQEIHGCVETNVNSKRKLIRSFVQEIHGCVETLSHPHSSSFCIAVQEIHGCVETLSCGQSLYFSTMFKKYMVVWKNLPPVILIPQIYRSRNTWLCGNYSSCHRLLFKKSGSRNTWLCGNSCIAFRCTRLYFVQEIHGCVETDMAETEIKLL